ncbi:MAG: hypothetical protein QW578_05460 [Thermoplasmatales archaeon]
MHKGIVEGILRGEALKYTNHSYTLAFTLVSMGIDGGISNVLESRIFNTANIEIIIGSDSICGYKFSYLVSKRLHNLLYSYHSPLDMLF